MPLHVFSETLTFDHLSNLEYHQNIEELIINSHASIGNQVTLRKVSLARSYKDADTGTLDGLFGRVSIAVDSYNNLVRVPEPVGEFSLMLVINNKMCVDCDSINDLKKVASVIGFESLKRYLSKVSVDKEKFVFVPERKHVLNLMERGRVDGMILSDVLIPKEMIEQHDDWDFFVLQTETLYHYLNRKHAHMVPQLVTAIRNEKMLRQAKIQNSLNPTVNTP